MWRGLYTPWRDKGLPFHTCQSQTFEWSHLGTSRLAKLPLNNSHRCYMKQKNHPAEVIFSIKPLYFGTEDKTNRLSILSRDEVWIYYILGSDTKLDFSGSHQNHIFFALGSSYCSMFSWFRGFLWTFWQDASTHLVLSKVIIRQLFGAVGFGVSGSSLIFYKSEISSGGILSQSTAGGSTFTKKTQF